MLLGTLSASLLGNLLTGKGTNRAGEGIVRAGYGNKKNKPSHPLTNFEIQKHQNDPRFNGAFSRDNSNNKMMGHI